MNMLYNEWNLEEALEVEHEEGFEEGREEGREEGIEKVARSALAEGASLEFIGKITGLDAETILSLGTN
jgi:predicted transposase/invertase (TIGR01784 family)